MTAGAGRLRRRLTLSIAPLVLAWSLGATLGTRAVSADCLLLCGTPQPAVQTPTPTPSPSGILDLKLPPCLVCLNPPILPLCGVTTDCRTANPPPPGQAPATPRATVSAVPPPSSPAGGAVGDAAAGGIAAAPAPAPVPSPSPPPAPPTNPFNHVAPQPIEQLSPVSGLSFGSAPFLWPLFGLLDAVVLIVLIVVMRKSWLRARRR